MSATSKSAAKIPVSERNLRSAAARLLSNRQIVSTEIQYIQRTMAARATRSEIDETVVAVRGMAWADIATDD
jgi:hypothetical protein